MTLKIVKRRSVICKKILDKLHLLNDDQSTVPFKQSTPKPVDREAERSDSGIVTTRSQKSHQTTQSRIKGIVEDKTRQQTTPQRRCKAKDYENEHGVVIYRNKR